MEAKELRIGNYVTDDYYEHFKKVVEIHSINDEGINIHIESECLRPYQENYFITPDFKFHEIKPIPLTEEWLLKLGYTYSPSYHYWIKGHLIWKPSDFLICDKNGIILKHVHQLQNLYFALTNEELTIKQ